MSKLTKALIPGYGANPTKPSSNPLSGLAPDLETGLPKGLPSGIGAAALKYSNPVGGIAPDVNGDIGYRKGWLDNSSNGTPAAPAKGPGYSVWGDPDMTKRGWGWGMDANGKLQTGVMGGGPAGTPWGPQGGAASPTPNAMGGPMSAGAGQQLAAQMRQGQGQGQSGTQGMQGMPGQGQGGGTPPWMQSQGGGAYGAGVPQAGAAMGGQPGAPSGGFTSPTQFPPQGGPGQSPQGTPPPWLQGIQGMQSGMTPQQGMGQPQMGIGTLINQLRQQAPQTAQ